MIKRREFLLGYCTGVADKLHLGSSFHKVATVSTVRCFLDLWWWFQCQQVARCL